MTDNLRYCEFCYLYRHVSMFTVGRSACSWCQAAWAKRRDDAIRKGLFTADELASALNQVDPPEPWDRENPPVMEEYAPLPTAEELNQKLGLWLPGDPPVPTEGPTVGTIFSHKGKPASR